MTRINRGIRSFHMGLKNTTFYPWSCIEMYSICWERGSGVVIMVPHTVFFIAFPLRPRGLYCPQFRFNIQFLQMPLISKKTTVNLFILYFRIHSFSPMAGRSPTPPLSLRFAFKTPSAVFLWLRLDVMKVGTTHAELGKVGEIFTDSGFPVQ